MGRRLSHENHKYFTVNFKLVVCTFPLNSYSQENIAFHRVSVWSEVLENCCIYVQQ